MWMISAVSHARGSTHLVWNPGLDLLDPEVNWQHRWLGLFWFWCGCVWVFMIGGDLRENMNLERMGWRKKKILGWEKNIYKWNKDRVLRLVLNSRLDFWFLIIDFFFFLATNSRSAKITKLGFFGLKMHWAWYEFSKAEKLQ